MKQSVDLMNSMTLMKSRHINTKRHLTGTARRASFLSTLLSSALLFGALTYVGTQQAQAQPVSITKDMPDAFETKTPTIGDGQYYYIQFYEEITYAPYLFTPFLAEFGDDGQAINAQDYLPFAANRLWTLEAVSTANKFKLKSKRGNYIYLDGNTFKKTSSQAQATEFELISRGSYRTGYYELRVSNGVNLAREKGNLSNYEWATIVSNDNNSVHNFVRFAQLKPNVAHIIYYRQEHSDGYSNSQYRANHTTTRHYLTYSGADNEVTASVIFNGDLNAVMGGGDASCFYIGDPSSTTPRQATITNDIGVDGSKGISITSSRADTNPQEWDTQFFIRSKDIIPAGKTVHVKFDYKASAAVNSVQTQAHSEPGNYLEHGTFGSLNFTTDWQTHEITVTVNNNINNFQTIAINLSKEGTDGVVYYFDNIVFEAPISPEVSSRRSIIPSDKSLWTLPTAAAYHQDGLWELIPDGDNGNFYIKRYGEEQYLTIRQLDTYQYYTVLGNKDDLYGRFELETPIANRYTRIHNTCRLWGLARYISYNGGDGTPIIQGAYNDNSWWYAGFYPVEVPVPNKDDFFQVRVGINPPNGTAEAKEHILLNVGRKEGVTYKLLPGSTDANMVGATFTPSDNWQNIFQYKAENGNALQTNGHKKIVVRFAEPVQGDWAISGIVNGNQGWEAIPQGSLYYEMDLTGITTINDFTIFTQAGTHEPISIAEVYFYDGTMLSESGNAINSSEGFPDLWQLEQVDDYRHFRLKNPNNGRYLAGNGQMTEPNDPNGDAYENARKAEINSNEKFWTDFTPKWYIPTKSAEKEIPVDYYVRHKESYLRTYAEAITDQEGLKKQGLATDIDSDWKNFNGNLDGFTQNVNHFEITHYVKMGDSRVIEFPTVLNKNNDHVYYQRFYNYGELDEHMNLDNLKAHVSLDTRDDGDVQYFLYKNGMVTGQKLDWGEIEAQGLARNAQRRFNFTNSDGEEFTVAVDVSRYSDLKYLNTTTHLEGDLMEPSLTMRYLFHMNDAKTMAASLTACSEGSDNWLEGNKVFHFGRTQVPYTKFKKVGYRGEFIPIRHIFSDYWVYDDPQLLDPTYLASLGLTGEALNNYLDQHLVSAVNDNNSGRIEVVIDPNGTGIRYGGYNPNVDLNSEAEDAEGNDADYQGFYFYDLLSPSPKHEYGNSRFIAFRYPAGGVVNSENPAYIKVYLKNGETRYQIAQFTIYFDANMATRPWTKVKNGTHYANGIDCVKGSSRDPNKLRMRAGHPIAKVSFDYPQNTTYHYPTSDICPNTDGSTKHDGGTFAAGGTIANSSPVPLTFNHTNYSFDGNGANWGSYALVTQKRTTWGNDKEILPADDAEYGYNIAADPGMQKAFLYIDASEQPGDICAVDFEGEFCANDNLMCTGWISGSNKMRGDTRCPGSITLTVKGGNADGTSTNTIYRFCPGQIYELDDGYGHEGYVEGETPDTSTDIGSGGVDGGTGDHVVWQQFYFEFSTDQKYERYWLEVNNNCVSSNGGDFMLDNIEVYTIVPEVIPEINTPLCVNSDGTTDMRLLKLDVDYNKLKSSVKTTGKTKLGFVFLEKDVFLNTLMDLKNLESTYPTLDDFAVAIQEGNYLLSSSDPDYIAAFNAALLGNQDVWNSNNRTEKMGSGVMLFEWDTVFEQNELYSFGKAVNKLEAVFREIDTKGTDDTSDDVYNLVFNGNYPELPWKAETEYYIVPANIRNNISFSDAYSLFNICSECSKASVFKIKRPYSLLGLDSSETTNDYVVCEGQIPTIVLNLKGYTLDEKEVDLNNLNFDWWLGKKGDNTTDPVTPPVLATLENYHDQDNGNGVKLDVALSTLRIYFPEATSLDGISQQIQQNPHPALTLEMVEYLQSLVDAGQLVLHQTSVNVPAEKASDEDPYFYIVACPIHDEMYRQALNPNKNEYVAYYCDEPQGLRIKVGQKAPRLQTGFVPGEHGFQTYNYNFPANTNPVLSIRLAKAAQFETVKNTEAEVANETDTNGNVISYNISEAVNYLWLPIRNAQTEGAYGVIKKSKDDNVYLASSNDPTWDKKISKEMNKNGLLPVVGRIAQLQAIDTKNNASANQNGYNRLSVYFVKNFNVREGYNYTLSLPFQEDDNSNACDGTILINLKIVPDYEVWTGAAGNIDWNNDENWRRADGNTTISNTYYGDELYRANGAVGNEYSPLHEYVTNKDNYYSSSKKANANPSKDQILRKGFAPLYCTHVLIKNDEWGNAPELYDALDYHAEDAEHKLNDAPFPNLRETSTPILKFDMQARSYDLWKETYGTDPDRGRSNHPDDLIAEMYQINSCDEIAFQPGTELRNAHLLNYNTAWMEYQLDNKRWYLLGSPLQGTISGEWYAPTGTAQQKTTYYDPVEFGAGYDRYSPAIYQRSWDKAKAVLYEIDSEYSTSDDSQTENLGVAWGGAWSGTAWQDPTGLTNGTGADEYLDRLGYKPMGGNKANVAIKGIWSNTYNDAQVDYATGGFSVMVMNHLKNNDNSNGKSIIRLPKEDTMYDYYEFSQDGSDDGGTDTYLVDHNGVQGVQKAKNRAKNRGRLKTDLLLPELLDGSLLPIIQKEEKTVSRYGDKRTYTRIPIKEGDLQNMNYSFLPSVGDGGTLQNPSAGRFTETIAPGISHLGFYLIENPFPCGLDMNAFFMVNEDILESKYWLLTATGQHLVQRAADGDWITPEKDAFEYPNPEASVQDDTQSDSPAQDDTEPDATLTFSPHAVLAPGQGFFVKAKSATDQSITVTFNKDMQVQSRFGVKDSENGTTFTIVVGQSQQTKLMYDSNNDGIPDTDAPEGKEEGDLIMIDTDDDDDVADTPTPVLVVPVYNEVAVDLNGNGTPGELHILIDGEYVDEIERTPVIDDIEEDVVIYKYKKATLKLSDETTKDKEYPLLSRQTRGGALSSLSGLVITAKRGNDKSSALVMQRDEASNDFLPSEDTETFILGGDFLSPTMPTVYTLCGRLATTINSIHDFRSLPLGVESASDAPCTLTFDGVELLGDSISFYDAVEKTLTPLESGMQFKVSGQTQNRYYLVRSLMQEEAAAETHLQIFTEGLTAKVIASTAEPILSVRCYDTAGQLVHAASPQTTEYSFRLPAGGVYIVEAQTDGDRKTRKVMTK